MRTAKAQGVLRFLAQVMILHDEMRRAQSRELDLEDWEVKAQSEEIWGFGFSLSDSYTFNESIQNPDLSLASILILEQHHT